ncbi:uncharacterized protein LOC141665911 [Apium graveolens]|uniref:uncharacterized protein LOC141665911 n=1 Tax=Apium graveolens TaxID=4045 RepID=UPI003D79E524
MSVVDKRRAKKPFGGITIVFGGDFWQILPVIPKASRAEEIHNRRIKSSLNSASGSLRSVMIPDQYIIHTSRDPIQKLFEVTYPDFLQNITSHEYLRSRAILTPTNIVVDEINIQVLEKIPGTLFTYISQDSIDDVGDDDNDFRSSFPVEYLNSINMPCIPKHELKLKVGVVVMLIKNLNQIMGLCNGTRIIVKSCRKNSIECEILCGSHVGTKHIISRIEMIPSDTNWPFEFKCVQFLIQICYAMTINKSQGQSLDMVGLYLPRASFSHGHIYVAIYRVTRPKGLHILIDSDLCNIVMHLNALIDP